MHPDPNDPRLTALALDEVDAAEASELEQHLAGCAACRQEVDRLRELAASLNQQLTKEPLPIAGLRPIRLPTKPRWAVTRHLRSTRLVAVAASLLIVAGVGSMLAYWQTGGRLYMADAGTETSTGHGAEVGVDKNSAAQPVAGKPQQPAGRVYPVADLVVPIGPAPASSPAMEAQVMTGTGHDPSLQKLPEAFWYTDDVQYLPPLAAPRLVNAPVKTGELTTPTLTREAATEFEGNQDGEAIPYPSAKDWERFTQSRPNLQSEHDSNTEAYDRVVDHAFLTVKDHPLSTFSIDVDTASYSNVRRFLLENHLLPPKNAVRIEELVNYFAYDYAPPKDDAPFAAHIEAAECPWRPQHRLVRIGLKGRVLADKDRPASNLVFLLDVSGSMAPANKLPLVQQAMSMLVRKLGENDRVAIVVYAGASGLVLPSTSCNEKDTILSALDHL
ncbi:MAG TPA: von Willebrand factor type A domain-containing protein, partial [Pirellulales bacterium]|nr:von Willebrand factor type A domain-containing protein [Pirellulales bacterium]